MNKLYLILSALLFLAITFAASSSAQEQNQTPPTERQILAVSTVRTINTAEAAYRFSKEKGATQHRDRFATWSDLYSSGVFDEMKPPTNVSSTSTIPPSCSMSSVRATRTLWHISHAVL